MLLNAGITNPGNVPRMDDYVAMMLDQEARAYIRAWNDALDTAVKQNKDKPLKPAQIGTLMLNMRYRFAFLKR